MTRSADIIIAGGGLNGLSLALALRSANFDVTVIDPLAVKARETAGFDGRSYALSIASKRVLTALGVWSQIPSTQPILEIKITDGRPGEAPSPLMLAFDHAEIEEGPMGFMAEDRHLRPALLAACKAAGVVQIDEDAVQTQTPNPESVSVEMRSGKVMNAALLIGCDGKSSGVATRAGIKRTSWRYDQSSLVCAVQHEKPHGGIAHQYFLPAGPLAILPLTENRSSIVWTERSKAAAAIQAGDDIAYLAELQTRFGTFLGRLELAGDRHIFPLSLSVADHFVADRVALVGDAAHVVHPIAGQGLNAGLKDVAALAEVLSDARRRGEDIGRADVLARYERWRRFDTLMLAVATDGFNRLFSNDNPLMRAARDIGLGVVNALPGLRRGFIREAAGLTGELPRLARGKKL